MPEVVLATEIPQTVFQWGNGQTLFDWIIPLVILIVMAWFVIGMYLVDCVELGPRMAVLLSGLRMLVLIGWAKEYLQN